MNVDVDVDVDVDDPSISPFDHVWRTFRAARSTLGPTPGALEAWHLGRRRYAVWLAPVTAPGPLAGLAELQRALRAAIVPVAYPHVTLWVAGFPASSPRLDDDVAEAELDAQLDAVRAWRAAGGRLRVTFGYANAFLSAAFVEVHDAHGDLAAVRAALAAPGGRELRFAPYLPHLTAGRFRKQQGTAELVHAIERLRAPPVAPSVELPEVVLAELDAPAPDAPPSIRARV